MSVAEAIQFESTPPVSPGLHLVEAAVEAPETPRGFLLGSRAVQAFYGAIIERGQQTDRHLFRGLFAGPGTYPKNRHEPSGAHGAFATIFNGPDNHNFNPDKPSILGIFAEHPDDEPVIFTAQIPFLVVSAAGIKSHARLAHPKHRLVASFRNEATTISATYDSHYDGPNWDNPSAVKLAVRKAAQVFDVELEA